MEKWFVIADDLTGAAEMAALMGTGESPAELSWDFGVLPMSQVQFVMTTETRNASAGEARSTLRTVIQRLLKSYDGTPRIFKKVDSLLRGRIREELAVIVEMLNPRGVLFAPAYPELGRTTVAGRQLLDGLPLAHNAASADLRSPSHTAQLADLLPLPADNIQPGEMSLEELTVALKDSRASRRAAVADATTVRELQQLAAAARLADFELLIGTGGLARQLLEPVPLQGLQRYPPPVVIVAGSRHSATDRQLQHIQETMTAGDLRDFLKDAPPNPGQWDVLILSAPEQIGDPEYVLKGLMRDLSSGSERIRPGALIVTGGDTVLAVLRQSGADCLQIIGELFTGVPLGIIRGGTMDGLTMVTKAGGFGEPWLLEKIVGRLITEN